MAASPTLAIVDYVVIAATLAVPLGMGVYLAVKRRKINTKEEYLLGGRKLHVLPVALSLFVTFMSSTSFIGMPAETFTTGINYVILVIAIGLSFLIGIFTVVPIMHTLQVTSMYECNGIHMPRMDSFHRNEVDIAKTSARGQSLELELL
ncbi:sodium-coupled monocarboxylate transporter 2-like [Haliotis asinina]|uniref:sodium-coupled monocarboxylate transporter 2-like n=1 Tax=Haliotis asinina TaxID=109174 RepID=UPI003531FD37